MTRHGLTMAEAAVRLGVSYRTMQRYARAYQQGDRGRGFDMTRIATQRGQGFEYRFTFPTQAAPDATGDTTPPPTVISDLSPVPDATQPATARLVDGHEDREIALLALRAHAEALREIEHLRAVVESLRRPWWRKGWEKVRGKR